MLYIHQYPDWTNFHYDHKRIVNALGDVRKAQGKLIAMAQFCCEADVEQDLILQEIACNAAIDGAVQDVDSLRNELLSRHPSPFLQDSFNAIKVTDKPISAERLLGWQASVTQSNPAAFRSSDTELTHAIGDRQLTFSGPHHETLYQQIANFVTWQNIANLDGIIKAAVSHFWLLTLRPFGSGNGRVTRMVTSYELSKTNDGGAYLYPINAEILSKKDEYFEILNKTQKGSGDITEWILWFLETLQQSIEKSILRLEPKANKIKLQQRFANIALSIREQQLVNAAATGILPKQFSAKDVGALLNASHDTALREIQSLIAKGVFAAAPKGGRSTKYQLAE